jgi:GT2 family glycosyltransferase
MELSVIIVSYNAKEFLKRCLDSVLVASENVSCEIFVVDNNSEDGSADMIKESFPAVKLIANNENRGFSRANNQAIRISAGRFVLLLNPDTVIGPDTFSKCIDFMLRNEDAGALGVKMINGEGQFLPESKRAFPRPGTAFFKSFGFSFLFPKSAFFNRYYLPSVDENETSLAEVISGAFMFLRRKALERSGLPDEDFFMYGEDIDLSYRLLKSGYKNYYFPEVSIIHFKGKSTRRDGFKDIQLFYEAMRIYVKKRSDEGNYPHFKGLIISAIYFREAFALANRFLKVKIKLFQQSSHI